MPVATCLSKKKTSRWRKVAVAKIPEKYQLDIFKYTAERSTLHGMLDAFLLGFGEAEFYREFYRAIAFVTTPKNAGQTLLLEKPE